jgi:hypothetical protein
MLLIFDIEETLSKNTDICMATIVSFHFAISFGSFW